MIQTGKDKGEMSKQTWLRGGSHWRNNPRRLAPPDITICIISTPCFDLLLNAGTCQVCTSFKSYLKPERLHNHSSHSCEDTGAQRALPRPQRSHDLHAHPWKALSCVGKQGYLTGGGELRPKGIPKFRRAEGMCFGVLNSFSGRLQTVVLNRPGDKAKVLR